LKPCECTARITCAQCVQARINFIRMLEKETRTDIKNTDYFNAVYNSWKTRQKSKSLHKEFKAIRKKKRWPLKLVAAKLGVSTRYVLYMERGEKPLNKAALELVEQFNSLGET